MSLKDKLLYPGLVTVFGGLIVLFIGQQFITLSDNTHVEQKPKTIVEEPTTKMVVEDIAQEPAISNGRFYIQTGRTYDLFEGDLSLTLPTWLEYSNSKIELKLSSKGKEIVSYKDLSIGDKVFYENYEITFIDTEKNITTYDVTLKILEL